jgi:hypothetical protein
MCTRHRLHFCVFLTALFIGIPTLGMTWNDTSADMKKHTLTLASLDNRSVQSIGCTDKDHFKFVREIVIPERMYRRKVIMLQLLHDRIKNDPFFRHLDLIRPINALEEKTVYIQPSPMHLLKNNEIGTIAWNNNAQFCAFTVRKKTSNSVFLLCARLINEFNTVTYKTAPIGTKSTSYVSHQILDKPYFIETKSISFSIAAAILSFKKNPNQTEETRLYPYLPCTKYSDIELDTEDGSLPRPLNALLTFPYLAEQCARAAHRSAYTIEPDTLICSLSTIRLHRTALSNDYKKKIKIILAHQGNMPCLENLSTEERLTWERFKHACS